MSSRKYIDLSGYSTLTPERKAVAQDAAAELWMDRSSAQPPVPCFGRAAAKRGRAGVGYLLCTRGQSRAPGVVELDGCGGYTEIWLVLYI